MKVVALNGSPRKDGNTATAIKVVLEVLEKEGIETEFLQLGGSGINPCKACGMCFEKKDGFCVQTGDVFNSWIAKVYDSEGITSLQVRCAGCPRGLSGPYRPRDHPHRH